MLKRVAVSQLTVGMFVHGLDENWLNHPFWRARFVINDTVTLRKLQGSGVAHCWIDASKGIDLPVEPVAVAQPAAKIEAPPPPQTVERVSLSDELQRAAQLRARSADTMRSLFAEARLGAAIEPGACIELVDDVVDSITRHPDALCSLVRLKTADEYTYLHSVAVCALMVSLGRRLGLNDAQCREAGLAGMFHDVGKAVMPQEILNKPGKLTDPEFDIIRTHARRGFELLRIGEEVNAAVADVVLHHHERFDGKGYPDRLAGDQISLLAKMGAVCDVYDAITSNRPYKAGWDPAHALSQMSTWQGHFDKEVFQSFVKCIGIYPTGSLVRLTSGRLGVVLEQNPASLTKPRIKVFFSTKSGLPLAPYVLDLTAADNREKIEGRELPEKWGFTYLNELWDADTALKSARG